MSRPENPQKLAQNPINVIRADQGLEPRTREAAMDAADLRDALLLPDGVAKSMLARRDAIDRGEQVEPSTSRQPRRSLIGIVGETPKDLDPQDPQPYMGRTLEGKESQVTNFVDNGKSRTTHWSKF